MDWLTQLPFRLGTTSYILPDDILPNARYLAGKVKDVELVLFEVDERQDNLPSEEVITSLKELAEEHDLTYTVHLPLDLRLGVEGDERHRSILKAERTIAATRGLTPQAYIVHLDGREVLDGATPRAFDRWREQARRALEIIAGSACDPRRLAVENLEHYPVGFWERALEGLPTSRCVDVGHLWLEGNDPLPYLESAWQQLRVVHLHGTDRRDHASLNHVEGEKLDAVLRFLVLNKFSGVVTLEVFGQPDFLGSCEAVKSSLDRIGYS
jgi:sugar phosphate isomerase/epimerase